MNIRLNKVIRELNVGIERVVDFLREKGFDVKANPNEKISDEQYEMLKEKFGDDKNLRKKADELISGHQTSKSAKKNAAPQKPKMIATEVPAELRPKVTTVGTINLDGQQHTAAKPAAPAKAEPKAAAEPKPAAEPKVEPKAEKPQPAAAPAPQPRKEDKKVVEAKAEKPAPEAPKAEAPKAAAAAATAKPVQEQPKQPQPAAEQKKEEPKAAEAPAQKPKEAEKPKAENKPAETKPAPEAKPQPAEPKEPKAEPKAEQQAQPAKPQEGKPQDSKPQDNKPQEAKAAKDGKSKKGREEAIGQVEADGIFHLHSTVELAKPKVLGKIDLSAINSNTRPKKKSKDEKRRDAQGGQRRKRNRIGQERIDVNAVGQQIGGTPGKGNNAGGGRNNNGNGNNNNKAANNNDRRQKNKPRKLQPLKPEVSDEEVAKQVRETLARLTNKSRGGKGAKYRREKRENVREAAQQAASQEAKDSKVLKLTEFVTANELAAMMNVPVTQVIATCMSLGLMVSINQRLDAETIDLVAEEFGFKTEYVSADVSEAVAEEADNEEDLVPRAPIVTVMGHVDHGKTSLLDYIRKSNVIAGEAGGITQHIGAYNVTLENGRHITFLDTPGHEAFTAMRARGAQVTDVAIIIIAADDGVMPQTKEAISHAMAANVPIVFAINKIDKPGANPDKIKEELANMNFLIEEWGGKYQSQDISAKKGIGVKELLDKVLLEADMLDLKANPNRRATGTIIESSLDRGRGYVATVLVSNGTLKVGDIMLAGTNYGRVKALFNERDQRIEEVGPSGAATVLGLNGAPQAGDAFHVMDSEQEVREIASKREQLQREQALRAHSVLSLDEIGRRIARGGTKELNIVVKGDVDGSVEALSDSLEKLSTEKIKVNVILKGVGQISENDVALAAASQAIIIGFQVRPSQGAKKQADQQGVEIRLYSIIYDAIGEVKLAMEGMLEPVVKEEVTATIEVRQVFHISKVGFVAGAFVSEGKVSRTDKARLIRDGIVIQTTSIAALKRFKDDVKEVAANFECGISLANCNDLKEGDIIETFKQVEVKATL